MRKLMIISLLAGVLFIPPALAYDDRDDGRKNDDRPSVYDDIFKKKEERGPYYETPLRKEDRVRSYYENDDSKDDDRYSYKSRSTTPSGGEVIGRMLRD